MLTSQYIKFLSETLRRMEEEEVGLGLGLLLPRRSPGSWEGHHLAQPPTPCCRQRPTLRSVCSPRWLAPPPPPPPPPLRLRLPHWLSFGFFLGSPRRVPHSSRLLLWKSWGAGRGPGRGVLGRGQGGTSSPAPPGGLAVGPPAASSVVSCRRLRPSELARWAPWGRITRSRAQAGLVVVQLRACEPPASLSLSRLSRRLLEGRGAGEHCGAGCARCPECPGRVHAPSRTGL